jgi:ABC-type transport system involved in cytochrome bd biosynthesis fused ATPase/permease subunit
MATLRVAFLSALVLELAATLGTAVVAVEIGVRLVGGSVTLQPALAALVLAPELYGPLRQSAAQFHASADGLAASARLFALLDLEPTVRVPARPLSARFGAVRLEYVTTAYNGRGVVLDRVLLTLQPGERVALVGASGAGKTTTLALLLRLIDPDGGRITVNGNDLRELDPEEWRRLVAWLPQRPRLEPGPVVEAIRCGRAEVDVTAAAKSADALMLLGRTLGEGGGGLSAGEVRRVALARALARAAPLLLLDEPTAHLDAASAAVVARAIERLPRSRTVLLVTHDEDSLSAADRVLELVGGRLRERTRTAA